MFSVIFSFFISLFIYLFSLQKSGGGGGLSPPAPPPEWSLEVPVQAKTDSKAQIHDLPRSSDADDPFTSTVLFTTPSLYLYLKWHLSFYV